LPVVDYSEWVKQVMGGVTFLDWDLLGLVPPLTVDIARISDIFPMFDLHDLLDSGMLYDCLTLSSFHLFANFNHHICKNIFFN
jgi:hypothetical protein